MSADRPKRHDRAQDDAPSPIDCIFGRGKRFQNHPGNQNLRRLIDERLTKFATGTIEVKKALIAEVFDKVKEGDGSNPPGRFLKQMKDSHHPAITHWEESTDNDARTKVGHTFRSRLYRNRVSSSGFKQRNSTSMAQRVLNRGGVVHSKVAHLMQLRPSGQTQPAAITMTSQAVDRQSSMDPILARAMMLHAQQVERKLLLERNLELRLAQRQVQLLQMNHLIQLTHSPQSYRSTPSLSPSLTFLTLGGGLNQQPPQVLLGHEYSSNIHEV